MSHPHTPAELLRASLVSAGLGVMRTRNPNNDWPVYVSHLPDAPANAICVYDTAGVKDGRVMGTGETFQHPGFQIRVRATDYATAHTKIRAVVTHLDTIRQQTLAVDEDSYKLVAVTQMGNPIPLGREDDGAQRESFTLNGILAFTRIT